MINIRTGCSGFYNRHWKGVFYPEGIPQSKWFEHYCEHFQTLELNTTFYKFPTPERLKPWFKKSPDDFLISVKAPRLITHFKKLKDCERLLNDFYTACEAGLKHKLCCTLFQLPPGIPYSDEVLQLITEVLYPDFKNVVEFRHESWWNKKVYKTLGEKNIIFCSASHPKLPEEVVVNSSTAYVRLHGTPDMFYSNYETDNLKSLYDTLKKKKKLKEAFVYFNNTAGIAGIQNALEFKKFGSRLTTKIGNRLAGGQYG
ncbi:MAG: hypothetical protein JWN78_1487 [Bacteroidota bacterium]|nr:hypothetical protein [Bacteroidota bacterium]